MGVTRRAFGSLPDGGAVDQFILANGSGTEARVMTYGGTLISLRVPDRYGICADVVLGFDSFSPYLGGHPYFGSLIGRYGNRIAHGTFDLHGKQYTLSCNDGENHLHGGWKGFDKVLWIAETEGDAVMLRYLSLDGEEGYPGNLEVRVRYALTERNELCIHYEAATDQPTVVNLTHHAYFNLAGFGSILGHVLFLNAGHYLPVDSGLIPTGEYRPVRGTPMDFTRPAAIGARIAEDDEQLRFASGGYDHTWVLDGEPVAEVYEPGSGRVLTVTTTQPGIQFYSGNFLDGTIRGKGAQVYAKHQGFCLETQHFPDSPNKPEFPSTLLMPGETYRQKTVYGFAIRQD